MICFSRLSFCPSNINDRFDRFSLSLKYWLFCFCWLVSLHWYYFLPFLARIFSVFWTKLKLIFLPINFLFCTAMKIVILVLLCVFIDYSFLWTVYSFKFAVILFFLNNETSFVFLFFLLDTCLLSRYVNVYYFFSLLNFEKSICIFSVSTQWRFFAVELVVYRVCIDPSLHLFLGSAGHTLEVGWESAEFSYDNGRVICTIRCLIFAYSIPLIIFKWSK